MPFLISGYELAYTSLQICTSKNSDASYCYGYLNYIIKLPVMLYDFFYGIDEEELKKKKLLCNYFFLIN